MRNLQMPQKGVKYSRKNTRIPFCGHVSVRLLSLMLGLLLLWDQQAQCGIGFVAQLQNVQPIVQVSAKRGRPFGPARKGTTLAEGASVRALRGGKATVIFNNGTKVALHGKNPQLEIVTNQRKQQPLVIRVLKSGKYWVYPKGDTEVLTLAAIAASQHTEYLLEVPEDDEKTTILTVIEGSVTFNNPQGRVVVRDNQQSTARVGQAPTPPTAVDVSGLVQWTADITGLPVEFEMPFISPDPNIVQRLRVQREAAVRANPDSAAAHQQWGEVLHDLGEYSSAVEEFHQAMRLSPQSAAPYMGLGRTRAEQGDTPGAIAAFQQARQITPDDPLPRIGEALAHLSGHEQERQDAAGQQLAGQSRRRARSVLEPVRGNALALATLGLVELREGNNPQAIEHLETAVRQEPQLYQAHALLALAYLARDQAPQALQSARRATGLQPNSAQAQGTLAMVLFFAGQPKEAMRVAQRATTLNPFSPFALLTQGRVFLSQLRTDEARLSYQQAAALAPNLWIVHTELGAVYLRLDRVPQAEAAYRRALELAPNSAEIHSGLGMALQRQGQTPQAITEYQTALRLDSRSTPARANFARLHIEQGQLDEAEKLLQEGNRDAPEFGIVYVSLSEVSLYRQNLFAAQEYARRAVQLLPDSALAHYQLGRVYLEQERTVQAQQQFRQAVTLDPEFAEARFGLGQTRERVESGRDVLRPLAAISGVNSSSAARALDIQNVQTPGFNERIQAAIQDPTVVRTASRSFGDFQLDALGGSNDTRDLSLSFLRETNERRGALGLIGQRLSSAGIRENADRTQERWGISYGRKANNNASGFFFLAQTERQDSGGDIFEVSTPILAARRRKDEKPFALFGFNLQTSQRRRTRALVQFDRPRSDTISSDVLNRRRLRSAHAEVRHDERLGTRHLLSIGGATGTRRFHLNTIFDDPDEPGILIAQDARFGELYLRDQWRIRDHLSLIGEIKTQRFTRNTRVEVATNPLDPAPPLPPISFPEEGETVVLPSVIVIYQPNARSGLRFRAHKLFGTIEDFSLLSPTDVFLFSQSEAPIIFESGQGYSYELEYDYTFRNASFLRAGLFQQTLAPAQSQGGEPLTQARFRGLRLRYEGVLNRAMTFFLSGDLNSARGVLEDDPLAIERALSQTPRFAGEAGLQYLNASGWFLQPSAAYLGPRYRDTATATREGGFAVANLRAGKRFGLRAVFFVEVINVFDKEFAVPLSGEMIPQPGRQVRFGLTNRF